MLYLFKKKKKKMLTKSTRPLSNIPGDNCIVAKSHKFTCDELLQLDYF